MITPTLFLRSKGLIAPDKKGLTITQMDSKAPVKEFDLGQLLEEYHRVKSAEEKGSNDSPSGYDTIHT
jgi:hypothetical protein